MRIYLIALLLVGHYTLAQHRVKNPLLKRTPETIWVDSLYNQMNLEERIGQLFMIAAYSNKDSVHENRIARLVKNYKIGGVIFFQGGPVKQANLTNRYQSLSKIPLFVGIDAEWGLAMRLDSVPRFPWNMTLGAIQNIDLITKVGDAYGLQSRRMGVHFNFAPVLDINTNPLNPIIGTRSFGEDKVNVTRRASALMRGIQRQGVFATGKHFPGHGDTAVDSHYTLPLVNFTKERMEDIEFYPYKKLFKDGLASVMVAHLQVPALEPRENYPSSLSYNIVTNVLQKELGFKGLIFTDALNMKGASNFKQPGDIDLEALLAGNDILLFAEDVPVAVEKICVAYQDSILTDERLETSVKKILKYKYKVGLDHYHPINTNNLFNDLNSLKDDALQYELYENAVTVIKNDKNILPIEKLQNERIAYVKLGDDNQSPFLETLKKYTEITEIQEQNTDTLLLKLKEFTKVIVGFHKADGAWKKHDFKQSEVATLEAIAKNNSVILDIFAKPYSLMAVKNLQNIDGIIVSYQNTDISQIVSAQLIFGAIEAKGKLPVSINKNFAVNTGLSTKKINRLGFTAPENVGMSSTILSKIDQVAQKAIDKKMTPGVQILVARHGKVVFQKSYGTHSYEKITNVKNDDIYDIASITKVAATLPNIMQLFDTNKLSADSKLGDMLPQLKNTNKASIDLKHLLTHSAGLQAWSPFYKSTLDEKGIPLEKYYKPTYSKDFSLQVAENLFIRNDYKDSILKFIGDSPLGESNKYKYSDFAFIILKNYLEHNSGKKLDKLSDEKFYSIIGMNNTLFNPLQKFDMSRIPPTENDNYFRHQTIQGYVHDMEAAMEGGIAGHAGLFSNSMDLAKIMQMYLQKGNYGNHEFFSEKTFDTFNKQIYADMRNRRGLGFDKPQLAGDSGPTCNCVSKNSFGHTGFTGTMAWADPDTEIIYIFLSNRTFPSAEVNNLSKQNIREDIQSIIQQSIFIRN